MARTITLNDEMSGKLLHLLRRAYETAANVQERGAAGDLYAILTTAPHQPEVSA